MLMKNKVTEDLHGDLQTSAGLFVVGGPGHKTAKSTPALICSPQGVPYSYWSFAKQSQEPPLVSGGAFILFGQCWNESGTR